MSNIHQLSELCNAHSIAAVSDRRCPALPVPQHGRVHRMGPMQPPHRPAPGHTRTPSSVLDRAVYECDFGYDVATHEIDGTHVMGALEAHFRRDRPPSSSPCRCCPRRVLPLTACPQLCTCPTDAGEFWNIVCFSGEATGTVAGWAGADSICELPRRPTNESSDS